MVDYEKLPCPYEDGLLEMLEAPCPDCASGLCCDLGDAFLRALGRAKHRPVTLHARGIGRLGVRLLDIQGDALRAARLENRRVVLIPLCSICAFYENELAPADDGTGKALLTLGGGGAGCRGCNGLLPELEGLLGKRVVVRLPEIRADMLLTEVIGLTMRAVSGDAVVTLRVDCIDALELPAEPAYGA